MLIFLSVTILMASGEIVQYDVREPNWTLEECETMRFNLGSFMYGMSPEVWTHYTAVCLVVPAEGEFMKTVA